MDLPAHERLNGPQPSPSEPFTVGFDSGNAAQLLVNEPNVRHFTSSRGLRQTLEHRRVALLENRTRDQFIVFTAVPMSVFSELAGDHSRTTKYCRFSYHARSGTLFAKVLPTPEHEIAAELFKSLVSLELHSMNLEDEVDPLGSTTVTLGSWQKEADGSWGPASNTTEPRFVVEVGLSESAQNLAADARGWLETSGSSVKLVITIDIDRSSPEVILHRWEPAPREYHMQTRTPCISACRTETVKLTRTNNSTTVTRGTDTGGMNDTSATSVLLSLPFEKVVGRPPNSPMERDLVISEQQLKKFAEKIWRKQGFM